MIPFNMPFVSEVSRKYLEEVLNSGHQQGDGGFTAKASKLISELVGGGHVLLTPSCTHALELASMLLNLGPGDEVILPSFTFTSAATAVTKFGASPVFVDIDISTKCLDVNQAREAITPRTRAISWVNYAGLAPNLEALKSIAKEFGLYLIEDNAHSLGGTYKGQPLGSFGDFATQSFHATKNIQCGEGGALIINNPLFVERAEILREKGTNRKQFIRGEVHKYRWVDNGSSYLLAEALSAILVGQLESFQEIQSRRKEYFDFYQTTLSDALETWTKPPEKMGEIAHIFSLEFKLRKDVQDLIEFAASKGVTLATHYQTLSDSPAMSALFNQQVIHQNSVKISQSLLRLPIWSSESLNVDRVVATTMEWLTKNAH